MSFLSDLSSTMKDPSGAAYAKADSAMGQDKGATANTVALTQNLQGQTDKTMGQVQQGMQPGATPQIQGQPSQQPQMANAAMPPGQMPANNFSNLYKQYRGF